MLYSPENALKVARLIKTQARRLWKPGDELREEDGSQGVVTWIVRNGRRYVRTLKPTAVQPGRGKLSIGTHEFLRFELQKLHGLTEQDAIAEGCPGVICPHCDGWGVRPATAWDLQPGETMKICQCFGTGWELEPIPQFTQLWDSIYAHQVKRQWWNNPLVWKMVIDPDSVQVSDYGEAWCNRAAGDLGWA